VENVGAGTNVPGAEWFDCFQGTYPNLEFQSSAPYVSDLTALDFLRLQSEFRATLDERGNEGSIPNTGQIASFTTFLDAIERTGLDELLTTDGPFFLLAPTDTAFTSLPKEQLDALLADPEALEALLRGHIVEGYFPYGAMGPIGQGFNRTVTNLRGEQLTLTGNDINGQPMGSTVGVFVANGTRLMWINQLLLPATT
jgi:uncharacterized surface protein with fasciclin (FAS1) repeats